MSTNTNLGDTARSNHSLFNLNTFPPGDSYVNHNDGMRANPQHHGANERNLVVTHQGFGQGRQQCDSKSGAVHSM
jgi:hypothetical protein